MSAIEAKSFAQWIAFGPFAFYGTTVLRDTGLLQAVSDAGPAGAEVGALADTAGLSPYGASVLLDFGLQLGLVRKTDGRFSLDKVGHFVLNDEMTETNLNFTRDVCYQALPFLEQSIREGRPAGLHTLGPWETLYQGLTRVPEPARSSWFQFDHYYSDRVFGELLPVVFEQPPKRLLDVGGNTGRWALRCLQHDPQVQVTLMDLPRQLAEARQNIEQAGLGDRAAYHAADLLDEATAFPTDVDAIWMSQFLDCFSEDEIRSILRRAAAAMDAETTLYIVELFPDRQAFDAASFSLDATSLYFTCIANGNSRMYHYDRFRTLVEDAGLVIANEIDDIGAGHTVLLCKRR